VSPWKVILATMVIFVCGVITGALVIETQGQHRPPFGPGGASFGPPGPREAVLFIHRMKQARIDLTTDQSNMVFRIIMDSQATNAEIRRKYAPQLRAETERAHHAISQVLSPDDRPKLEELEKELAQNRGGRGGESGGGRGGEGRMNRPRNPNRGGSNDFTEELRGRMDGLRGRMDATATSNVPLSNAPPTNAP